MMGQAAKFRSLLLFLGFAIVVTATQLNPRLTELDAYWAEVSRSVQMGDFDGYSATCHPQGVLVTSTKSLPLSEALAGWEPGFRDTAAGKLQASVEFRFSTRRGDATTAHETGIFHYATVDSDGQRTDHYVHFEATLRKINGTWLMLVEHQKGPTTEEEWEKLK